MNTNTYLQLNSSSAFGMSFSEIGDFENSIVTTSQQSASTGNSTMSGTGSVRYGNGNNNLALNSHNNNTNTIWVTIEITCTPLTNSSNSSSGSGENRDDNPNGNSNTTANGKNITKSNPSGCSLRRTEVLNNLGEPGVRLSLTAPRVVDGEQATIVATLLFEQIDLIYSNMGSGSTQNSVPQQQPQLHVIVERVKFQDVQFTMDGVIAMNGFLSAHASTIKHVSIKKMFGPPPGMHIINNGNDANLKQQQQAYTSEQEAIFEALSQVFETSKLEILNLSDNYLPAGIWMHWSKQVSHGTLRQLILDYVYICEPSMESLRQYCFPSSTTAPMGGNHSHIHSLGDTLEELYVVLLNIPTLGSVNSTNGLIRACRNLQSLRWAIKDTNSTTGTSSSAIVSGPNQTTGKLPLYGLADMSSTISTTLTSQCTLLHLVLDGGTISSGIDRDRPSQTELGNLCIALENMTQLRTIKIRNLIFRDMDFVDIAVANIGQAIVASNASIESIDLSRNCITSNGATDFVQIICQSKIIIKSLHSLFLDRNPIDINGACNIYEIFGMCASLLHPNFDIKMDCIGNLFSFSNLALLIASRASTRDMQLRDEISHCKSKISYLNGSIAQNNVDNNSNIKNSGPEPSSVNNSGSHDSDTNFLCIKLLQEEISKLKEEKHTLIKAYTIMGSIHQVDECTALYKRIQQLEETAAHSSGKNSSFHTTDSSGSNTTNKQYPSITSPKASRQTTNPDRSVFHENSRNGSRQLIWKNNDKMEQTTPITSSSKYIHQQHHASSHSQENTNHFGNGSFSITSSPLRNTQHSQSSNHNSIRESSRSIFRQNASATGNSPNTASPPKQRLMSHDTASRSTLLTGAPSSTTSCTPKERKKRLIAAKTIHSHQQ
jgi:hypothetical protein